MNALHTLLISISAAFTASMGDAQDREYEGNARIEFPAVVTNIGGYYNSDLHEFTCPTPGLYMFTVSIRSGNGGDAPVRLMLDEAPLIAVYADARHDELLYHSSTSTNIVVAECDEGQKVWAQCFVRDCTVFDSGSRYSSFSGMLLHAN